MKGKMRKVLAALITTYLMSNATITFAMPLTLSIDEAIDMALKNNYNIKIAEKDEAKAQAALKSAKSQQDPSVSANVSMGITDVNDNGFERSNNNNIRLSMPLYTGGKNELNIEKAKDSITASELALIRTKENTMLDTITAYYNVLEAEKIVAVDKETVDNYQEHLNDVKNLYQAGSTPKVDLLRSEVELVNAQQTLLKSQNSYDIAVSKLKNIIKFDSEDAIDLLDDVEYHAVERNLLECIAYAKENRVDLKKYQVAIEQAQKDIDIAKGDKKPSVSLSVGTGWNKQILPDHANHSLTAAVEASWNLFDGNITAAKIKDAELSLEQAELEYYKQADAIDLEVREAYLNMQEAEKRFHTTKVAVSKAEEDYFIAKEKYKAGAGVILDIIDAQLALTTAKTNYIQAQYDYASYKATLDNVMGVSEEAE
ncbi:TolC family protein [Anaerosinus sp.]|uniref:TolC family protein n=1 Tax=Selenobaculum sp. TaxID=3074374 RepID=UPI003AB86C26